MEKLGESIKELKVFSILRDDMFDKCPICGKECFIDWWVPDEEWKRYIPKELRAENICISCYLKIVEYRIRKDSSHPNIAKSPFQAYEVIDEKHKQIFEHMWKNHEDYMSTGGYEKVKLAIITTNRILEDDAFRLLVQGRKPICVEGALIYLCLVYIGKIRMSTKNISKVFGCSNSTIQKINRMIRMRYKNLETWGFPKNDY